MKALRTLSTTSSIIFLLGALAWAQGTGGKAAQPAGGMTGAGPGMMGKGGMPPEMMRRCRMMMNTPIFPDCPYALSARADELGLTPEQRAKLAEIGKEARTKALDVLTAEQRKSLGDLSAGPMSMMQMCRRMCPMMKGMRGGEGAACPMMRMMKSGKGMGCPMTKK